MPSTLLITGSSGIAEATALRAMEEGWRVFIVGRERAECETLGSTVSGHFIADVANESAVQQAFDTCIQQLGPINAVFHVAGSSGRRFGDGPVHECTLNGWEETFAANARTAFLVSRAAVRHWLKTNNHGALLNISSVLAFSAEPAHFSTHAYAASKSAVIALSRAIAAQYAAQNIRVNVLAPGLVRTPMSLRAQNDESISAFIQHKQPLSHGFLESTDIAQTALFLLSDKARHITGQVISVDGGWTL